MRDFHPFTVPLMETLEAEFPDGKVTTCRAPEGNMVMVEFSWAWKAVVWVTEDTAQFHCDRINWSDPSCIPKIIAYVSHIRTAGQMAASRRLKAD